MLNKKFIEHDKVKDIHPFFKKEKKKNQTHH